MQVKKINDIIRQWNQIEEGERENYPERKIIKIYYSYLIDIREEFLETLLLME
jgi:hypothetical protein